MDTASKSAAKRTVLRAQQGGGGRWARPGPPWLSLFPEDPHVDPELGSAGLDASKALLELQAGPFVTVLFLSSFTQLAGRAPARLPAASRLQGCRTRGGEGGPTPHLPLCAQGAFLGDATPQACPRKGTTQKLATSSHFLRIWSPG